MPRLVGKSIRVVDHDGLTIDELVGNVASQEDTLSIARVVVSQPTAEPWLTLEYDEWIAVLKGSLELHYAAANGGEDEVLTVSAGQACFVSKGERFRPVFPTGDTEYVPVCLPAFKPERCHREEDGPSPVSSRLRELHGTAAAASGAAAEDDKLYHMCQKELWDAAVTAREAYFPPTYEADGHFTHATAVPARLIETANHFYTATTGDWICVQLSKSALKNLGVVTRLEEPKAVGETQVSDTWGEWRCPHIFGGLPGHVAGVVTAVYPMERDSKGVFLSIKGLVG